jgi:hypothetical protein
LLVDPRVSKEAQSPVTLQLDDVPLETAVRLMAEVSGLKAVRMGNVLFVTNKANAAELRAEPDLVPPLKSSNADEVVVPGIGAIPGVKIAPGVVPPPAVPVVPEKANDTKETKEEPKKDEPKDDGKKNDKPPEPKPEKK